MKTIVPVTLAAVLLYGHPHCAAAYIVRTSERATPVSLPKLKKQSAPNPVLSPKNDARDKRNKLVKASRKKWGVDKDHEDEYWFNDSIHMLGNTGFLGALHAAIGPISTKLIDMMAYDGIDVRQKVAKELASNINKNKVRVLDLCCGVGMSTRALRNAFPNAEEVIGVDTSPEMVSMARAIAFHDKIVQSIHAFTSTQMEAARNVYDQAAKSCMATFTKSNAEHTPFDAHSFDLVTIMYALHEAPKIGREHMFSEARRLLSKGGTLALIDISPDYKPSETMLEGEPYMIEYQKNIKRQLRSLRGFSRAVYKTLVPGHVGLWVLKRV